MNADKSSRKLNI